MASLRPALLRCILSTRRSAVGYCVNRSEKTCRKRERHQVEERSSAPTARLIGRLPSVPVVLRTVAAQHLARCPHCPWTVRAGRRFPTPHSAFLPGLSPPPSPAGGETDGPPRGPPLQPANASLAGPGRGPPDRPPEGPQRARFSAQGEGGIRLRRSLLSCYNDRWLSGPARVHSGACGRGPSGPRGVTEWRGFRSE
jgi:hypothetical protein